MARTRFSGLAAWVIVIAGMAVTMPAGAVVYDEALHAQEQKQVREFTRAAGFLAVDEAGFDAALDGIACPDCEQRDMAFLARALLQVDAREGAIPHARYRVLAWFQPVQAGEHSKNLTLLEITRLNHGKRISDELRRDYGEHARPPLANDRKPHVQWRMAIARVPMSNRFEAHTPTRRVLDDASAAALDCLGSRCMRIEHDAHGEPTPPLPRGTWSDYKPRASALLAAPSVVDIEGAPLPHIAWFADVLAAEAGVAGGAESVEVPAKRKQPDVALQIDMQLDGQDVNLGATLCQQDLADDSIKDQCWRVRRIADTPAHWQQYIVQWPQRR